MFAEGLCVFTEKVITWRRHAAVSKEKKLKTQQHILWRMVFAKGNTLAKQSSLGLICQLLNHDYIFLQIPLALWLHTVVLC